jgi:putative transposase
VNVTDFRAGVRVLQQGDSATVPPHSVLANDTVPHVPLSHPFVERVIGTMRRECLDHVLFWNGHDLERKLAEFQQYYNAARSHASLDGRTPLTFAGEHAVASADLSRVRWVSHCHDLVQLPVAA